MDLFILKKVLGVLIMPVSIILILLLVSLICFKFRPKISFYSLVVASSLFFLSTFAPFAHWLSYPLEHKYDSFNYAPSKVDYIIVLGCGHTSDDALPATSQLKSCSLERLVEGVRIYWQNPHALLITSGAKLGDESSNAEKVKAAAISLGVPASKILTENFPKDTEEEAELIAARVKGKSAVLVTSAYHMPRAITFFKQQGVDVFPAPASPYAKNYYGDKGWPYYMPNSKHIEVTTRAWYERIGQLWQWLKS